MKVKAHQLSICRLKNNFLGGWVAVLRELKFVVVYLKGLSREILRPIFWPVRESRENSAKFFSLIHKESLALSLSLPPPAPSIFGSYFQLLVHFILKPSRRFIESREKD